MTNQNPIIDVPIINNAIQANMNAMRDTLEKAATLAQEGPAGSRLRNRTNYGTFVNKGCLLDSSP